MHPRAAVLVARRAVALGLISTRAWVELKLPRARGRKAVLTLRKRTRALRERARVLGAWDVMTLQERRQMTSGPGGWSSQQTSEGSWEMEGAGTLLWTLEVAPQLPMWGQPMTMETALGPIMPAGAAEKLGAHPHMRTPDALAHALTDAANMHWRTSLELARRKGKAPPGWELAVHKAAETAWVTQRDGKDFLASGVRVAEMDAQQLSWLDHAAAARLSALEYACGR